MPFQHWNITVPREKILNTLDNDLTDAYLTLSNKSLNNEKLYSWEIEEVILKLKYLPFLKKEFYKLKRLENAVIEKLSCELSQTITKYKAKKVFWLFFKKEEFYEFIATKEFLSFFRKKIIINDSNEKLEFKISNKFLESFLEHPLMDHDFISFFKAQEFKKFIIENILHNKNELTNELQTFLEFNKYTNKISNKSERFLKKMIGPIKLENSDCFCCFTIYAIQSALCLSFLLCEYSTIWLFGTIGNEACLK